MRKNNLQSFDLFVPFGEQCITSWNLRKNNLQTESLPFDWLAHVKLNLALDLLQNIDYQALLDNAEIAYHLAAVYAALGQKDKAVSLLTKEAASWPLSKTLLENIQN